MTLPVIATLAEAKEIIRMDYSDHDAMIQGFIDTATEEVLHQADGLDLDAPIPSGIKTAVLLHVLKLYDGVDGHMQPEAASQLARRHRDWSV